MRGLLKMPLWVKLWMGVLMLFNGAIPMFYLSLVEARVVLATMMGSALLMGAITGVTGFTRLVRLGHFVWFGLAAYLWGRLDFFAAGSPEGIWLRGVIVLNLVSLLIDSVDVVRYIRGERTETVLVFDAQHRDTLSHPLLSLVGRR